MSSNGTHTLTLSREGLMRHIADLLRGKKRGESYRCHCPAHDDKRASLSLGLGSDGRILLYCHAGCEFESIANELERMEVFRVALAPSPSHERDDSARRANGKI
jgi:hypothetical protein